MNLAKRLSASFFFFNKSHLLFFFLLIRENAFSTHGSAVNHVIYTLSNKVIYTCGIKKLLLEQDSHINSKLYQYQCNGEICWIPP